MEDLIAELKAKHGEVHEVRSGADVVLVRPPRPGEYRKFRSALMRDDRKADAAEALARDCIVHPTGEALNALLDRKPALADVVGGECLKLAGASSEAEAKKL